MLVKGATGNKVLICQSTGVIIASGKVLSPVRRQDTAWPNAAWVSNAPMGIILMKLESIYKHFVSRGCFRIWHLQYYDHSAALASKKSILSWLRWHTCIINKEDIANNFNSFFQNIGLTFSANIPQHKDNTIKTFLKEKIAFSFQFSLLEQEKVSKIINKINPKHSCGHDDISYILAFSYYIKIAFSYYHESL